LSFINRSNGEFSMPLLYRSNFDRRADMPIASSGLARRLEGASTCQVHNIDGRLSGIRGLVIGILLLASALPARAAERPLEIGVLALGPRNVPVWSCGPGNHEAGNAQPKRETMPFYVLGLLEELDKLNYNEIRSEKAAGSGHRFNLDIRMGTSQELRTFARELARKPVDIIVAVATAAVRIAQEETRDHPIPILFPGISDPVGDGFVQSLARPGGFITGVSHQQVQGSGKRLELFKEMLPGLHRLIVIRSSGYGPAEKSLEEIRATADRLKIDVLDWTASNRDELKAMLSTLRRDTADGIMILPDSFVISSLDLIIPAGLAQGVPTFGLQDFMADWGALGAYGPSAYQAGGRVARYIDKIVKGAKPGDLPVEPTDPILVVNLKVASCLGISIPLEVLHQADRVVR
jgi:putative ABC transport system substrate-binding protein